jgi:hypothetical protein
MPRRENGGPLPDAAGAPLLSARAGQIQVRLKFNTAKFEVFDLTR